MEMPSLSPSKFEMLSLMADYLRSWKRYSFMIEPSCQYSENDRQEATAQVSLDAVNGTFNSMTKTGLFFSL